MGAIRDSVPERDGARVGVSSAGPGSSTYLDYDERIAKYAQGWLKDRAKENSGKSRGCAFFHSFVRIRPIPPHRNSTICIRSMMFPGQSRIGETNGPTHPALEDFRTAFQWTEPLTDEEVRRMIAAYLGCCTHLDRQIGKVLTTLGELGLTDSTRIVYTSDHGESMGRRGLWGKFTMYEESAGVPFIMAGPDIPAGNVSTDNVTLVDSYQTIMDSVGVPLTDRRTATAGFVTASSCRRRRSGSSGVLRVPRRGLEERRLHVA